jgi:hypothetical protein
MENDAAIAQSHVTLEERIRSRAHQIWLARGGSGLDSAELDDWLEAERQVLGNDPHFSPQSRGTTVGSAFKPDYR